MAKIGSYSRLGSIGRPDRRGRATGPGERFVGQHHDLAPDLVLREGCGGRFRNPALLPTRFSASPRQIPKPKAPVPAPLRADAGSTGGHQQLETHRSAMLTTLFCAPDVMRLPHVGADHIGGYFAYAFRGRARSSVTRLRVFSPARPRVVV
jgi:hypothetical protein